jgi:protein TonB
MIFVVSAFYCAAQPDPILPDPPPAPGPQIEEPLVFPEVMPAYPGGETQLFKDIAAAMIYPPLCLENEFQGKVFVQFVVEKNGKISNVAILRQPEGDLGKMLGKEAIRVVKNLKDFTPGSLNGEPKRVRYTLPIYFKIK